MQGNEATYSEMLEVMYEGGLSDVADELEIRSLKRLGTLMPMSPSITEHNKGEKFTLSNKHMN